MEELGKILVLKADGSVEAFDRMKLTSSMWRAMHGAGGKFRDARSLAETIEVYLTRKRQECIETAAIAEMCAKIMRRVLLNEAADRFDAYRAWREDRRNQLHLRHDGGIETLWDKNWICELVGRCWNLSPVTSRIIAGMVERDILDGERDVLYRDEVIGMLNDRVASLGLADVVPVRP